jgi:hypothetical protein
VAKNEYSYPPDEFDQVDFNSRPKEVHAARRGAWSQLWPFLLVIVLVPAIAFAVVFFLGDRLSVGGGESSSPPPSSTPPAEAPESDTPEVPEDSGSPDVPEPIVDKTTAVTVYNNGSTAGAAAGAVGTLKTAGYLNAVVNTERNTTDPAASSVYYATAEQLVTAQDVASALNLTDPVLNPTVAGVGIVVILK